jgi:hypothetical protein
LIPQPDQDNLNSTTSLIGALQESEALGRIEDSGVMGWRDGVLLPRAALQGDSCSKPRSPRYEDGTETVVINAAFLGMRINGRTTGTNKPIVVDVDLPVWKAEEGNVR